MKLSMEVFTYLIEPLQLEDQKLKLETISRLIE